jgi:hypothetical protein
VHGKPKNGWSPRTIWLKAHDIAIPRERLWRRSESREFRFAAVLVV